MNERVGKRFKALFDRVEADKGYLVEHAKVSFAMELWREVQASAQSKADLARRIGKSGAYITKVFRGDTNFTLGSMVGLAEAVGARLHVHLAREDCNVRWVDVYHAKPAVAPTLRPSLIGSQMQVDLSVLNVHANVPTPAANDRFAINGNDEQRAA